MATETELLADLLEMLRPIVSAIDAGVVFKHNDMTSGLPDVSASFNARTSWWEFKLADPQLKHANELQHLNMRRLAIASVAWYVVWEERNGVQRTCICEPRNVSMDGRYVPYESTHGWNHKFVVDFVRRVHGLPV